MWKSKKVILVLMLAIAALVGTTTGVALAQTGNGDESQPEARHEAPLDRVCEIYEENTGVAIDPGQLKDAFAQAQSEMRDEALESWLQNLVEQGKILPEEAKEYLNWRQAMPDITLPGPKGHGFRGGMMGGRGFQHGGGSGPYCAPDA